MSILLLIYASYFIFIAICNGFNELLSIIIDVRIESDESECNYWLRNNIYTHCVYFWNCFNGEDEIGYDESLLILNCSCNEHIYIYFNLYNNQVDCPSAFDAPVLYNRYSRNNTNGF
ncbi:unnamed protein product [Adineta steineri]|uniref:Uncharacterized protein n=1 Tax=Adineta steineri TaxID=433720 RepID=A0A815QBQ3_9BILA|nr:unnamed protein product [Adineta steineri]CAF1633399.1 unnamed protein product [Adineta steineri]